MTDVYLSLRIFQSRPSLASEGTWTWKMVLATDSQSGADFEGETRTTFLSRFNLHGASWQMPFSADGTNPDPFGNNHGATYATSPPITNLVAARIADAGWATGGDIVVGLLDNGTIGIAEADVDAQPDYARLHLAWTTTRAVQTATSALFKPALGARSYHAQYGGDGNYVAADGPCMPLTVTAADAPPSVGGVAALPDVAPAPPRSARSRTELAIKTSASLIVLLLAWATTVRGWQLRKMRRR